MWIGQPTHLPTYLIWRRKCQPNLAQQQQWCGNASNPGILRQPPTPEADWARSNFAAANLPGLICVPKWRLSNACNEAALPRRRNPQPPESGNWRLELYTKHTFQYLYYLLCYKSHGKYVNTNTCVITYLIYIYIYMQSILRTFWNLHLLIYFL